ncbi:hypothetical protein PLESTF_001737900 [Pleodorina starrii]|nr:hypothetical protein PLESTF_001737900 [Pleodorina starrii]
MVSHVATAEETAADCSKAQAVMMPTPMAPAKKGIPKAPTSSASSSAPPASSRLQRVARITKRLPAAPAGGDVGRNCDDTAALQQPSTAIPCPPPSSSTAGPQQPVEEQPCGCSGDEGPAATTSDACASSDLLRSASSSSCGDCPSSSLSASSSCSLRSSSSSSRRHRLRSLPRLPRLRLPRRQQLCQATDLTAQQPGRAGGQHRF